MIRPTLAVASVVATLVGGCDDSQAWHAPDWSLSRMQEQPRVSPFDPQMSAPPPFTVDRSRLDDHPCPPVTRALVERGRTDFDTICATCHGIRGDGVSVVATKMLLAPPRSLLEPRVRKLSDAQIGEVIARGYGLMASYENELPPDDRCATVAYVRALEVAQGTDVSLLPPTLAAALREEAR